MMPVITRPAIGTAIFSPLRAKPLATSASAKDRPSAAEA